LIERYGLDAKLFDWSDEITADCPRKQVRDDYDARLLMLGSSEPNAGADEFGASIDLLLKAFTRLTNGCDGNVPCCIGFGRLEVTPGRMAPKSPAFSRTVNRTG
jgi:hypothetical protein